MKILDNIENYKNIIEDAKKNGLNGFEGHSLKIALLIKHLLIPEGEIIGFVNKEYYDNGFISGYFFVHLNGYFYDINSSIKNEDLRNYWGHQNYYDSYHSKLASELGLDWTKENIINILKISLSKEEAYTLIPDKELLFIYRDIIINSKENIENNYRL